MLFYVNDFYTLLRSTSCGSRTFNGDLATLQCLVRVAQRHITPT